MFALFASLTKISPPVIIAAIANVIANSVDKVHLKLAMRCLSSIKDLDDMELSILIYIIEGDINIIESFEKIRFAEEWYDFKPNADYEASSVYIDNIECCLAMMERLNLFEVSKDAEPSQKIYTNGSDKVADNRYILTSYGDFLSKMIRLPEDNQQAE